MKINLFINSSFAFFLFLSVGSSIFYTSLTTEMNELSVHTAIKELVDVIYISNIGKDYKKEKNISIPSILKEYKTKLVITRWIMTISTASAAVIGLMFYLPICFSFFENSGCYSSIL